MKKRNLCIVGLVILLLTVVIFMLNRRSIYVQDYFAEIGLINRSHESVIEKFGEPNDIIHPDVGLPVFQYDGIEFIFFGDQRTFTGIALVRILSPEFRLGRRRIGVGSTREEILHAYRHSLNIWEDPETNDLFIHDGKSTMNSTWLYFYFDEDDRVEKIEFYWGG